MNTESKKINKLIAELSIAEISKQTKVINTLFGIVLFLQGCHEALESEIDDGNTGFMSVDEVYSALDTFSMRCSHSQYVPHAKTVQDFYEGKLTGQEFYAKLLGDAL